MGMAVFFLNRRERNGKTFIMTKQAVILAGGRGTRLGPLTRQIPKPLLPIGGRPFLDHLVWNLSRHGIDDIILSCGYLGEQIADHFRGRGEGKVRIRSFIESTPLGTGGALRFLAPELADHFFLLNGDSLFDINYLDLPLPSGISADALATLALHPVSDASRYGRVETNGARIVRFLEKDAHPHPGLIHAGLCWLDRPLVDRIPDGFSSLERDLFPLLATEGRLFGKQYGGYFIDIGIPDDYHRADRALLSWHRRPALFFDRDGVINVDHGYIHTPDQFEWISGAIQAIRWCNEHGHLVIIVTNQSGIARGLYDDAQFWALTAWMADELATRGAHMDAVYYCPHHPSAGMAPQSCRCRKPHPGLLEQAMSEWDVDRGRSLLIGDKASDLEAAQRAGITGHLFPGGRLDLFLQEVIHDRPGLIL